MEQHKLEQPLQHNKNMRDAVEAAFNTFNACRVINDMAMSFRANRDGLQRWREIYHQLQ